MKGDLKMSANVEWMFSGNNETPWHGIGEVIQGTLSSEEAIKVAKLDWDVIPMPIFDQFGNEIPGYKVNTRSIDNAILGIVTDYYKIVNNRDAFKFTDALLGEGVQYETAGSLDSGKKVWMLARMEGTVIAEEQIDPYLVFTNSHDGKGAIRVAAVPVRVVCQNTLNLALSRASRHWSCVHKGDLQGKLDEAKFTLASAEKYMEALEEEFGELKLKTVTDKQVEEMTDRLLQIEFNSLYNKAVKIGKVIDLKEALRQQKFEDKLNRKKSEILTIYHEKPDLVGTEKSAFRFVNAVSDYATHTNDHKQTKNYKENLFMKTVDGNNLIDTSYQLALAV